MANRRAFSPSPSPEEDFSGDSDQEWVVEGIVGESIDAFGEKRYVCWYLRNSDMDSIVDAESLVDSSRSVLSPQVRGTASPRRLEPQHELLGPGPDVRLDLRASGSGR